MQGLSPVAASGGHSSSRCAGLSLSRPLLLRSTGSRRAGSVVVAHGGLVAPRHVGSSQTRARTRVPCIGRQILNHCATREAPQPSFLRQHQHFQGSEGQSHQLGCNTERYWISQITLTLAGLVLEAEEGQENVPWSPWPPLSPGHHSLKGHATLNS